MIKKPTEPRKKPIKKKTGPKKETHVSPETEFKPGNQFWKARSSHGRNPKFSDKNVLWEACLEYFQWVDEHPLLEDKVFHTAGIITRTTVDHMRAMTIDGLCLFL
ncbi:hypothetical protein LCGC14_2281560, partial [marine sediment metagenome]